MSSENRLWEGNTTEEEVAAVMAVLTALRGPAEPESPPVTSGWTDRAAGLRTTLRPGPDAWRLSARR